MAKIYWRYNPSKWLKDKVKHAFESPYSQLAYCGARANRSSLNYVTDEEGLAERRKCKRCANMVGPIESDPEPTPQPPYQPAPKRPLDPSW